MSDAPEVQIAVLKTEVDYLKKIIDEVRQDTKEIKETLSQAKGGWKTLLLVAGISSTVGALITKLAPWFAVSPR
jgi:chromosome condensin MukBEF ATPase and DNA-binding subunit MukB